ncbi:unnamed protein product [Mytilus coruscus]|uniref:Uncharacterized protein n=1 Tax=Mytilus coruscus TaxID=42192 RepID=A0A6J8D5V6_MYTCO|nr:unnamed protein product [Mytilus coruscus]
MRHVSMRDCIVIFYLENLLRLRVHADPDPGLNRTSQICTLPMTLKGLPRDSYITNLWHSLDYSEETYTYYDRISLEKEDHNLLFEITKTESEAKYLFEHEMYLGYLNNIKNSEEHFLKILSKQDALNSTEAFGSTDLGDFNVMSVLDDFDTLNNTLHSLSMYDPAEHLEYEQTESDGGDSLEENIDALDIESIELKENFMEGIERLDLSVNDMIEKTTTHQ